MKTTNNVGGTGKKVVTGPVMRSALLSDFMSALKAGLKFIQTFLGNWNPPLLERQCNWLGFDFLVGFML